MSKVDVLYYAEKKYRGVWSFRSMSDRNFVVSIDTDWLHKDKCSWELLTECEESKGWKALRWTPWPLQFVLFPAADLDDDNCPGYRYPTIKLLCLDDVLPARITRLVDFQDYYKSEEEVLKPALESMGLKVGPFKNGEADSFGPLSRRVSVWLNNEKKELWYG